MKNKLTSKEKSQKNRAYNIAYYKKNKEAIKECNRVYREKNKEAIKARDHAYYEKNKETINVANRAYYEKNKESIRESQNAYCHPTEITAQLKYLLSRAKSRAKKKGFKFNLSLDEALHIYYSQDGKCAYTKKRLTMGTPHCPFKMSPDQIIPGGGYTKENVQFVTSTINKMKLNLTPKVFVQVITDIYENLNSN